jgi:ribosomal protein S18 acetylase RimI-like enzyme
MKFYNLRLNDLNKLAELFKNHLFYLQQDKSVDQSSPKKVARQLFFHYILSKPLNFFGLDLFVSFVAQTNDGNIVGSITARRYPLARSWVIGPVVCHKDFRNRGIATNLMNLLLKYLKTRKATSVLVSTEKNNKKGLMFFEKFGFEYINHVSLNHEGVRNYVRKIAITYGYLLKPRKIQLIHSMRTKHVFRPIKETKMWYILLKTIDDPP